MRRAPTIDQQPASYTSTPMPPGFNMMVARFTEYTTGHSNTSPVEVLMGITSNFPAILSGNASERQQQLETWAKPHVGRLAVADRRVDSAASQQERAWQEASARLAASGMLHMLADWGVPSDHHRFDEFCSRANRYRRQLVDGGDRLTPAGIRRLGPERGGIVMHYAYRLSQSALWLIDRVTPVL